MSLIPHIVVLPNEEKGQFSFQWGHLTSFPRLSIAYESNLNQAEIKELKGVIWKCWQSQHTAGLLGLLRPLKGAFFDMDATVVAEESIDLLAAVAGSEELVANLTCSAMNGELDFQQALRERVKILAGLPLEKIEAAVKSLTLNPGITDFAKELQALEISSFLVSGGFECFAKAVYKKLGLSGFQANRLASDNYKLIGKIIEPIVDGKQKKIYAKEMCQQNGWAAQEVFAVGDGANDRDLMEFVGIALGFHPKSVLLEYLDLANFTGSHRIFSDIFRYIAACQPSFFARGDIL